MGTLLSEQSAEANFCWVLSIHVHSCETPVDKKKKISTGNLQHKPLQNESNSKLTLEIPFLEASNLLSALTPNLLSFSNDTKSFHDQLKSQLEKVKATNNYDLNNNNNDNPWASCLVTLEISQFERALAEFQKLFASDKHILSIIAMLLDQMYQLSDDVSHE